MKATEQKNLILQYYNEYQSNISLVLPNMTIEYYDSILEGRTDSAYVEFGENEEPILRIDCFIDKIHKLDLKSFMFHEFTHIFDYTLYKSIVKNVKNIASYSEVHATYIQLMSSFYILKQDDIHVSLSDTLNFEYNIMTLSEYLNYSFLDIFEFIENFYKMGDLHCFYRAYKHTLYYFGAIRFCEDFCLDNITDRLNFDFFENCFGSEIIDIFNLVKYPFDLSESDAKLIIDKENAIFEYIDEMHQLISSDPVNQ